MANQRIITGAVLLTLLAASGSLVACGGSGGGSSSPAPPFWTTVGWNDTNGDAKSSSMGVSIQAGGEAYLKEPDNPTTGFQWHFDVPPGVTQASSVFTGPSPSASPLMGAGGTRTVTFSVPQPGTYVVVGTYSRPWESKKPARTVRLSIYANPRSQPAPAMVFTEKSSPGTFTTDVGACVAIDLKENPSTGYAWTMRLGPGLKLVNEQVVTPASSPSPLVGAGGQHLWFINVEKPGATTVTGIYARPADAASKSADFSLTIEAK